MALTTVTDWDGENACSCPLKWRHVWSLSRLNLSDAYNANICIKSTDKHQGAAAAHWLRKLCWWFASWFILLRCHSMDTESSHCQAKCKPYEQSEMSVFTMKYQNSNQNLLVLLFWTRGLTLAGIRCSSSTELLLTGLLPFGDPAGLICLLSVIKQFEFHLFTLSFQRVTFLLYF